MDYSKGLDSVNSLCSRCIEREGIDANEGECYICNGLMDRLDEIFALITHATKEYEFKTFLIGATLPSDILEREDEFRSRLKIRGRKSIKNEITSTLGKMLNNNAKVSFTDPDINIHLDLKGMFVTIRSKPIYLFGRYKKEKRGLEQRSMRCNNCNGIGCHLCDFKGSRSTSIESILSDRLITLYNADNVKFSWIGGEDEESLVLNEGRPFFVKIINPRKRSINYKDIRIVKDGIDAWFIKQVSKFPDKSIKFRTKFSILAVSNEPIDPKRIEVEYVYVINKNRKIKKRIYNTIINYIDDKNLEMELVAESGLPIKKFVEGGVEPNLSKLLQRELVCKHFDVLDVILD